ncbi:sensor histidine kinase [Pseudoteredinibacter isoporae]|uniref:sensor histidine kinase n=1 Tax=Pseudoteredinibacter isoporae TaxID=570281 RepID=UPI00310C7279
MIKSIRQQTLLLFISYTVGLGLLYFVLALMAAFVVEDEILERLLNIEAEYIEARYDDSGVLLRPRLAYAEIYPDIESLPEFARTAVADRKSKRQSGIGSISDREIFTERGEHYHFQILHLGDGQQAFLLAEVSRLLVVSKYPALLNLFLLGLFITLLLALYLAYKMASFTSKPVLQLAEAVRNKDDLPVLDHELGYLSDTLDQAFRDADDALRREKDFSRDVSHELRTPLTVLSNTITLAENRLLNETDLDQLRHIDQQMQHTIDVLLALARRENLTLEDCYVAPILEQAVMDCSLAAGRELEVRIELPEALKIRGNPSLLSLLFSNLVNNALYHASNVRLNIDSDGQQLVFHNLSNQPLEADILQAGVKGGESPGIGQGLYLVSRILDALALDYRIAQEDGQFTVNISL